MKGTVTVRRRNKTRTGNPLEKVVVTFSALPGREWTFPWPEAVKDLRISALLEPVDARNLVLDALAAGTATRDVG